MGRTLFWIVMAGITLFAGMAFFPSAHTALNATDTTGFPDLLASAVKFLPYALVFFIGYLAYKNFKGGQ